MGCNGRAATALAGVRTEAAVTPTSLARWSPTGGLGGPRSHHTATVLRDGRVLIAGGFDGSRWLAGTEVYDPRSGAFRPGPAMAWPRVHHSATLLSDGSVLLAGGYDGTRVLASVEVYLPDPDFDGDTSDARIATAPDLPSPRSRHTATRIPALNMVNVAHAGADEVLFVGGTTQDGEDAPLVYDAVVYEPVRGTEGGYARSGSIILRSLPRFARVDHTATLLTGADGVSGTRDDRVLIYGGLGVDPYQPPGGGHRFLVLADPEVYDPWGEDWVQLGANAYYPAQPQLDPSASEDLVGPRRGHRALSLRDGSVLLVGGENGDGGPPEIRGNDRVRWAERLVPDYDDLAASRIHRVAAMAVPRRSPQVAPLGAGLWLVSGGFDPTTGAILATTEVYLPGPGGEGVFLDAGRMSMGRVFHTSSPAGAAGVIVVGGLTEDGRLGGAETYAPPVPVVPATAGGPLGLR
ncbi:MAG: hypothetical protein HY722_05795 [Planctomycetes bacterium]|nr:hypothetical protein [Planctomycetota bacterium]